MRNRDKRELVESLVRAERQALWENRPPLTPDQRKEPAKTVSLLDTLARAMARPADMDRLGRFLMKTLPARYDGYDWWADSMPKRQIIRDSVVLEVRNQGYVGVPPKLIDKVTSAVVTRAKRRGCKPKHHVDSWHCDCDHCAREFEKKAKQLLGALA